MQGNINPIPDYIWTGCGAFPIDPCLSMNFILTIDRIVGRKCLVASLCLSIHLSVWTKAWTLRDQEAFVFLFRIRRRSIWMKFSYCKLQWSKKKDTAPGAMREIASGHYCPDRVIQRYQKEFTPEIKETINTILLAGHYLSFFWPLYNIIVGAAWGTERIWEKTCQSNNLM